MTVTGFGTDTWCSPDAGMVTGRFARGRALVSQAIARRLSTPRGSLLGGPEEEVYGFDLAGLIGTEATRPRIAALPGRIRAELLKDDRIVDAEVKVFAETEAAALVSLRIEMSVSLADESRSFPLTLAVTDVGLSIVGTPS